MNIRQWTVARAAFWLARAGAEAFNLRRYRYDDFLLRPKA